MLVKHEFFPYLHLFKQPLLHPVHEVEEHYSAVLLVLRVHAEDKAHRRRVFGIRIAVLAPMVLAVDELNDDIRREFLCRIAVRQAHEIHRRNTAFLLCVAFLDCLRKRNVLYRVLAERFQFLNEFYPRHV